MTEPRPAEQTTTVPPSTRMPTATSYDIPLDELERSARVPFEEQVLEEDIGVEAPEDDGVGHLPGGIRPYAL